MAQRVKPVEPDFHYAARSIVNELELTETPKNIQNIASDIKNGDIMKVHS